MRAITVERSAQAIAMESSVISQRMLKFAPPLVLACVAYWALRQLPYPSAAIYNQTAQEAEGLNTVILLIGGIFSVMYAFVIFVIWGQFTDVENFVMRECNSLSDLLRFSEHVDPDAHRAIRRAVTDYARSVLKAEWRSLAEGRRNSQSEQAFSEILDAVLSARGSDHAAEAAFHRLTEIAQEAGQHRDERITKSLTRIPPTLLRLVHTMAGVLLLLVFFYPYRNWVVGLCCFALLAVVLFLANVVMEDTDNPFEGICNVSPQPFGDLLE